MLKEMLRGAGKSISSQPHPDSDTPETFEYKGRIVCVAPGGDTRAIVEANCRYFKMKNCDFAISATRTRWGSAEALNAIINLFPRTMVKGKKRQPDSVNRAILKTQMNFSKIVLYVTC